MRTVKDESTLLSAVYRKIRRRILNGTLPPGQPVSRRRLAMEMRTSLLPAAGALQRLELEGLIESRPRKGTRVRALSRENLLGHFVLREALETQVAMRAERMASATELERLDILARALDAPDARRNIRRYASLHGRFHRQLAAYGRCGPLYDAVEQCHAFAALWLSHTRRPSDCGRLHQDLVEAISSRDPEKAAQGMQQHLAVGITCALEHSFRRRANRRQPARPHPGGGGEGEEGNAERSGLPNSAVDEDARGRRTGPLPGACPAHRILIRPGRC